MIVIVPNYISDQINKSLDVLLEQHPDAAKDRDVLYQQVLSFVDEYGYVPDFSLTRNVA